MADGCRWGGWLATEVAHPGGLMMDTWHESRLWVNCDGSPECLWSLWKTNSCYDGGGAHKVCCIDAVFAATLRWRWCFVCDGGEARRCCGCSDAWEAALLQLRRGLGVALLRLQRRLGQRCCSYGGASMLDATPVLLRQRFFSDLPTPFSATTTASVFATAAATAAAAMATTVAPAAAATVARVRVWFGFSVCWCRW